MKTSKRIQPQIGVGAGGWEAASGGSAALHPHGALVLGRVHQLGAGGRLAAQRAAQLAHESLASHGRVDMDDLARQRRPVAVHAAVPLGLRLTHAAVKKCLLKGRTGGCRAAAEAERGHGLRCFDAGRGKPSRPAKGLGPIDVLPTIGGWR